MTGWQRADDNVTRPRTEYDLQEVSRKDGTDEPWKRSFTDSQGPQGHPQWGGPMRRHDIVNKCIAETRTSRSFKSHRNYIIIAYMCDNIDCVFRNVHLPTTWQPLQMFESASAT